MAGKTQERKAALREKLLDIAEEQIASGGLASVKARDLAKRAGCALGAIYNVFDDLTGLFMAVNGRTFVRLGAEVARSVAGEADIEPRKRLILMSNAYLHFASENTYLWRALFDLEMTMDGPVPGWYLVELEKLFAHISKPLAEMFPDMDHDEIELMTRALFSSVHGIVLLGLERRISGVPPESVEKMIAQVLSRIQ